MSGYRLHTRHYEASAVGGSFVTQGGLIAPQVSFCCPIRPHSNKEFGMVLNKQGGCPEETNGQNALSILDH